MSENLLINSKDLTFKQVEWDSLSSIISQFCYFERNKKEITENIFSSPEDRQREYDKIDHFMKVMTDDFRQLIKVTLTEVPQDQTLEQLILRLQKGGSLRFGDLNYLAHLIEGTIELRAIIEVALKVDTPFQSEFDSLRRIFLKEFRYLVEKNGDVNFERHPELKSLMEKLRDLEEKMRRIIQEWLNDSQHSKLLQFNSYDLIHDRFVVPIRSDSYRSELGFIISRSETGATLFVEPFEVRELCNRRLELVAKIDEIIHQIENKFSQQLSLKVDWLTNYLSHFQELDFYQGKSEFCLEFKLSKPRLSTEKGFELNGLFHPLLKNPIKNNVRVDARQKGIVISGPNTGGKTVFLKSVILSYILFQRGFFVPAQEAVLYPYSNLYYFGNDWQDLKSGLSSFSGEVQNYLELLDKLGENNLILIDEIFNSTSSDEASALSLAFFDEIHRRSFAHIIVSTHHQMFKTLVHQNKDYQSCHVGFDPDAMKPTYKIQWGTPGSSMALTIFKLISGKFGNLEQVVRDAQDKLNKKNISYETLLHEVSVKKIELEKSLVEQRKIEVELRNQKGAMEGLMKLKLQEEIARAKVEIDKIIKVAQEALEEAKNNPLLKAKRISDRGLEFKAQLQNLNPEMNETSHEEKEIKSDLSIDQIKAGDQVYSLKLKKDFIVLKVDPKKQLIEIGKGPIKITVPLETLVISSKKSNEPKIKISIERSSDGQVHLDARGMRLAEFQDMVNKSFGQLLAGDIPFLHIIHGHGDGVLKKWLRDQLKHSKEFMLDQNDSGNDGESRIILR